jgi:hypothetical protein
MMNVNMYAIYVFMDSDFNVLCLDIAELYGECENDDPSERSPHFHAEKRSRQGNSSFNSSHRTPFHVDRTTASLESEIESLR